jgi:two-component system response regulator
MSRKAIQWVEDIPTDEDITSNYRHGANNCVRRPAEFHRFADAVKQLGLYWLILNEASPPRTP